MKATVGKSCKQGTKLFVMQRLKLLLCPSAQSSLVHKYINRVSQASAAAVAAWNRHTTLCQRIYICIRRQGHVTSACGTGTWLKGSRVTLCLASISATSSRLQQHLSLTRPIKGSHTAVAAAIEGIIYCVWKSERSKSGVEINWLPSLLYSAADFLSPRN